ncbi:MAG: hypothetical protein ACLQNE_04860 [Thermoguttaceae bacterium]
MCRKTRAAHGACRIHEAKHDPPKMILGRLKDVEKEIAADIKTLEKMLG